MKKIIILASVLFTMGSLAHAAAKSDELHCKVFVTQVEGTIGNYPQRIFKLDVDRKNDFVVLPLVTLEDGSTLDIRAAGPTSPFGGQVQVEMQNGDLSGVANVGADGENHNYPEKPRESISSAMFDVYIECNK